MWAMLDIHNHLRHTSKPRQSHLLTAILEASPPLLQPCSGAGVALLINVPVFFDDASGESPPLLRGWRNTAGNLIEFFLLKHTYHRPQFIVICVSNGGVRFHRIRDFKQYYFNSIPPASHLSIPSHNCISAAPHSSPLSQLELCQSHPCPCPSHFVEHL